MSDLFDEGAEQRQPVAEPRRSRALIITAAILIVGFFALTTFAAFWTDRAWYDALGFGGVFSKLLWTRIGLFLVFGGLMGLVTGASMYLAYRFRPLYRPPSPEQSGLDRYREVVTPIRMWLTIGTAVLLGLFAGTSASGQWREYLLWRNGVPFGSEDAYFGPRPRLLRLRPALAPLPRRLRDGVRRRRVPDGRTGPLPLRRHPAPDPWRPPLGRGPGAAVGAAGGVRAGQGRRLLAGPVRPGQRQGVADHRHDLHRRERRAAGQEHPDGHRGDLRRAVLPQRVAPHLDAAVGGPGPARAQRGAARHDLAGHRAAVPGQPAGARPGGAVHRREHRGHARGVRPGGHRGRTLHGRDLRRAGLAGAAVGGDFVGAAGRPAGGEPHLRAGAAGARLLLRRAGARRRPLRDRRAGARPGARRP